MANREGNQAVWDRWNAMAPAEQAANFVAWEERLVGALEALTDEELATARQGPQWYARAARVGCGAVANSGW